MYVSAVKRIRLYSVIIVQLKNSTLASRPNSIPNTSFTPLPLPPPRPPILLQTLLLLLRLLKQNGIKKKKKVASDPLRLEISIVAELYMWKVSQERQKYVETFHYIDEFY